MAFCSNCGVGISDHATTCPECGAPQNKRPTGNYVVDNGGFGWGLLGFCFPVVGIILYFVWKDQKPNTAKVLLTWALISFALGVLSSIMSACTGAFQVYY